MIEMLTTKEAAKKAAVRPEAIVARINNGTLPAEKIAGVWFIKKSDLENFKRKKPGPKPCNGAKQKTRKEEEGLEK